MKINIQAPWEVNTYLEGVIIEKMEKLAKFYQRIQHIDVFLKNMENVGLDDKLIEVRLRAPRSRVFCTECIRYF